jgi:protein gp37
MENSRINWTHHTYNPWYGCEYKTDQGVVDPACEGCYAEALMDKRYGRVKWGKGRPRQRSGKSTLAAPLRWNREAEAAGERRRVFSLSLGDWLDDSVPVDWLADLLSMIDATPHLDWLLLTKRIENWESRLQLIASGDHEGADMIASDWLDGSAPENVWLGVTCGDQRTADLRIPKLCSIPASVHFLSMEPLVEAVDLNRHFYTSDEQTQGVISCVISWVIVGGKSGATDRPFRLEWAESIVEQCEGADVACWVKQMGTLPCIGIERWQKEITPLKKSYMKYAPADCLALDFAGKGEDMSEFPQSLRVRELPNTQIDDPTGSGRKVS